MKEKLQSANSYVKTWIPEHPIEYVVACVILGYVGGRALRSICE